MQLTWERAQWGIEEVYDAEIPVNMWGGKQYPLGYLQCIRGQVTAYLYTGCAQEEQVYSGSALSWNMLWDNTAFKNAKEAVENRIRSLTQYKKVA